MLNISLSDTASSADWGRLDELNSEITKLKACASGYAKSFAKLQKDGTMIEHWPADDLSSVVLIS